MILDGRQIIYYNIDHKIGEQRRSLKDESLVLSVEITRPFSFLVFEGRAFKTDFVKDEENRKAKSESLPDVQFPAICPEG